jgi:hypothetical protein
MDELFQGDEIEVTQVLPDALLINIPGPPGSWERLERRKQELPQGGSEEARRGPDVLLPIAIYLRLAGAINLTTPIRICSGRTRDTAAVIGTKLWPLIERIDKISHRQ